ncbi:MAG: CatB-related O-acetyltransferase [Lachnospiraceae bacterium]|nr:CatB-related O-acetyltransferase [Lachnospiraceae bacterium]
MLKRKLEEILSLVYRRIIYPFVRMATEVRRKSIMKQGSYLNKGSVLCGKNYVGKNTVLSNVILGYGSYVNSRGDLSNTRIGRYSSIGSGVRTVLGRHPVRGFAALHPAFYSSKGQMGYSYVKKDSFEEAEYIDKALGIQVEIGNDVWIGNDVSILEGARIGDGAVVGAKALVKGELEAYGIYAGIPAKKIGERFDRDKAEELLKLKWWDRDEAFIRSNIDAFKDPDRLILALKEGRDHE